jgi:cysteine desulfurase
MGFSEADAACALRVSLGPRTARDEVLRFADAWAAALRRRPAAAA